MSVLRIVLPVATMLLLAASSSQAATVYKWTDQQGVVQYTDAPPEGKAFERMEIGGSGTARAAEEPPADASAPAAEPTPAQRRLDMMKSNCATARANLETLRTGQEVTADSDGDGTPEPLDEAGRAKAQAAAEEAVRQNCVE